MKTRRARKNRRKTQRRRRYVGGAPVEDIPWYKVTLRNALNCVQTNCPVVEIFYLSPYGKTYGENEYKRLMSGESSLGVDAKSFNDRVHTHTQRDPKTILEAPKEPRRTGAEFLPISQANPQAYLNLKKLEDAIHNTEEGTSPAQYRAYLLASRIEKQQGQPEILHNMFCRDAWADRRPTDIAAYALLQALYSDRQDGGRESGTADELRAAVSASVGAKVLTDAAAMGSSVESFANAKFAIIPTELDPYCKQVAANRTVRNTGDRTVVSGEDKEILLTAYSKLRDLYDRHLQDVVDILKKVVIPRKTSYGQMPTLELTPEFETDERGAMVFLEERIKEARGKISAHYLAVEQVYTGALQNMRQRAQGRYVSPTKRS